MANEEAKTQNPDAPDSNKEQPDSKDIEKKSDAASEDQKKSKKPKKKIPFKKPEFIDQWIFRLAIGTLIITLQIGASYFILKKWFKTVSAQAKTAEVQLIDENEKITAEQGEKPEEKQAEEKESNEKKQEDKSKKKNDKDAKNKNAKNPEFGGLYTLSDLIVNPAMSAGRRFFIVSIVFAFPDKEMIPIAQKMEPILQDRICSLLSQKTDRWFADSSNRDVLRRDVFNIAQKELGITSDTRIYFTKYILQ
jgi:flagellar basal body-associated protein FliL